MSSQNRYFPQSVMLRTELALQPKTREGKCFVYMALGSPLRRSVMNPHLESIPTTSRYWKYLGNIYFTTWKYLHSAQLRSKPWTLVTHSLRVQELTWNTETNQHHSCSWFSEQLYVIFAHWLRQKEGKKGKQHLTCKPEGRCACWGNKTKTL